MNKTIKFATAIAFIFATNTAVAENDKASVAYDAPETPGYTVNISTSNSELKFLQDMKPTIRFGGFIMGNILSMTETSKLQTAVSISVIYAFMPTEMYIKTFIINSSLK